MKKLISNLCLPVLTLLAGTAISSGSLFVLDGYKTTDDNYTERAAISFYNGHKPEAYGTADNPLYETYVEWGEGKLLSDPTGDSYFFMYVETPIEVKNMVWGDAVTTDDIDEYKVQFQNHHPGKLPKMDFKNATGSEYMAFYDAEGNQPLKSNLVGPHTSDFVILDAKTSVDYLLNGFFADGITPLATEDSSAHRNVTMAFEYRFTLDNVKNNELLDVLRNDGIIEYHLSPERGLIPTQVPVPEPKSALLLGLSSIAFLLRRRREAKNLQK